MVSLSQLSCIQVSPDVEAAGLVGVAHITDDEGDRVQMCMWTMPFKEWLEELIRRRAALPDQSPESVANMHASWFHELCVLHLTEKAAA